MKKISYLISLGIIVLLAAIILACQIEEDPVFENPDIISYEVDLKKQALRFFLKNDQDENFKNFKNLKKWLNTNKQELLFAMNGGMYQKDLSPQGLYIEKGKLLSPLDTIQKGYGNFYLQPNGIFYLTKDHQGIVCKTSDFENNETINYATQSGPMLLIDGAIHPKFKLNSKSVHIRNGVGILPNGHLLFAISKKRVNFYTFASFFKKMNCKNALYLDGFVSRMYLPSKNWIQEDGNFGVMIGEIDKRR